MNSSHARGMSLLELLIYIAILAGLMAIVSDAFISLSKARGQSEARSEVNSAIRFATEKIRQDIKNAGAVTTPVLGTTSPLLNVTINGATVDYTVISGQLFRTSGGSSVAVTGPLVFVSAPTFTRLENYNAVTLATTTAIQVSMTVRYNATSTDWTYSDSLRTAVSLR